MRKVILVLLFITTPTFAVADATSTATITIRDGAITAFTGVIELAASTTPPIDIAPTSGSAIAVPADSLLATLVTLDATTPDFDITDLAYFSSFDSFIINCISIPTISPPHCFNWTYAVNGTFPQRGADDQILHDGDVVHLFFGPPRQTALSTTSVTLGESFTATAQTYDLDSGTYVGAPGLILGVGTSNPDFSFTELATSTSDASGNAIFSVNATGTFAVGIQEDFYFPSASITIIEASTTTEATSTPPTDPPPSGGGGGGGGPSHFNLNIPNALAYLVSKQNPNGSYGSPESSLYTDWTALAFASADPGTALVGQAKTLLRTYLLTATPAMTNITDYERHAMALQALGIDPYSGTPVNYIAPIVAAFDGTQIGTADWRDDIFAIFPLMHAGYTGDDTIIKSAVAYIISKQTASGSWGDADTTAAAIQALGPLFALPNVNGALGKAVGYLKSTQQNNGSWGGSGVTNIDSTSWVQTAINAIPADPTHPISWTSSSGSLPTDAIANAQQSDGAVRPISDSANDRVWSTSYAVVAASGKSWLTILQSFPKPTITTAVSGGGGILGTSTSMVSTLSTSSVQASSTQAVATSTPSSATSTSSVTIEQDASPATTASPAPKPIVKKVAPPKAPAPASTTTASPAITKTALAGQAAAASSAPNFFAKIWHKVTSFFGFLF